MLLSISIKNFGPFRDKTVLSTESTKMDGDDDYLADCKGHQYPLLTSAVILGPNASGKSYVLRAIATLQNMLRGPLPPNFTYPWYEPFCVSNDTMNQPVEIGVCLIDGGIKYDYSISFCKDHITEENLYYYPNKRKALVFMRKEQNYVFGHLTTKGLKPSSKLTPACSSFLVAAAQFNNDVCNSFHNAIVNKTIVLFGNPFDYLVKTINDVNEYPERKKRILNALRIADFGIVNINGSVQKKKLTDIGTNIPPQVKGLMMMAENIDIDQVSLHLTHSFNVKNDGDELNKNVLIDFPFSVESNGTIQILCLMSSIVNALEKGYVIMIDEFGTFIHSEISKWIVSQFKNIANPNKAQLIVNTHDQSLLDLELLRRDQIWFTNKRDDGSSELYALSDFKGVRQDANIMRDYSLGRFGAKPFIEYKDVMD